MVRERGIWGEDTIRGLECQADNLDFTSDEVSSNAFKLRKDITRIVFLKIILLAV